MPQCKSCGKPIVWLKNAVSGSPAPIDAEPSPGGNISTGFAPGYYAIIPQAEAAGRTDLHRSHFSSCEFARQHRKGK